LYSINLEFAQTTSGCERLRRGALKPALRANRNLPTPKKNLTPSALNKKGSTMTTKYTEEHEWLQIDGNVVTVGITLHAAQQLGDVVFVDLPAIGKKVEKGKDAAVVESVKAASDVFAPVSGEIIDVNTAITNEPSKVSDDPEGSAWFTKIKISDPAQLESMMDKAAYEAFLGA
jgi:glycine cleavage system H protein